MWILVQFHPKGTQKKSEIELRLYKGSQAKELIELGMDTKPAASWPLAAVEWEELLEWFCYL